MRRVVAERLPGGRGRACDAREVVEPGGTIRPVQAEDLVVLAAIDHDVDARGVDERGGIAGGARSGDGPGEVPAVDDGIDANPAQLVEMIVGGPVDDVIRVGSVHVIANRVAVRRRPPRNAAEIVMADGVRRPGETVHGSVAAAIQQDPGIPPRVDVRERASGRRRSSGIRREVPRGGAPLCGWPQLVQTACGVAIGDAVNARGDHACRRRSRGEWRPGLRRAIHQEVTEACRRRRVHGPASTHVGHERDLLSRVGHDSSLC